MNELWKDVRFRLRMLAKTPGTSLVAIVIIALGIGGVLRATRVNLVEALRP